MSSAMKNRDNHFGRKTTVIVCKRWFKSQVKHYLYLLLYFFILNLIIMANYGFSRPMLLVNDQWQSNIFIWIGQYLVSFTGESFRGNGDKSNRHFLYIGFDDKDHQKDLTGELGFFAEHATFQDFLDAIEKVKSLNSENINRI
jgi:hypothetical protein